MRAIRLMVATAVASVLTVFAVLGMIHMVEIVFAGLNPSPISVSEARLDFGRVPLNGVAAQTLVVRNDGDGPIHARFVVLGEVWAVDPEELILEPGIEWDVTVWAAPDRPGRLYDVLRIQIVGGDVAGLTIPLAAEAGPEATGSPPGRERNFV
jgi:hypothetical protein